jgi:hypothetical protein
MTDKELDAWLVWTASLQNTLFDELDRMRVGETNATKANAIARKAIQMLRQIKSRAPKRPSREIKMNTLSCGVSSFATINAWPTSIASKTASQSALRTRLNGTCALPVSQRRIWIRSFSYSPTEISQAPPS